MLAHWDEVEPERADVGPLRLQRYDLGTAAGTVNVGVTRARVDPGAYSSPVHVECDEEEIFYVLGGSGLSWQDGKTYEVRPGDCIVHRVSEETHTLVAGPSGLDVLAFGERGDPTLTYLPRAGVVRAGVTLEVAKGRHPWEREANEGPLELPAPSPRPPNIVNAEDVEDDEGWRELGDAAGSRRTGLNHVTVQPGALNAPPHCHSAEEEIFVILEGEGTLELTPSPGRLHRARSEQHPVRAGHVVSRPPGTGVAHVFRAGDSGLTLLAYGTREPNDITYYPRSNKINWRGVGVIGRIEHVDYWEGEDLTG